MNESFLCKKRKTEIANLITKDEDINQFYEKKSIEKRPDILNDETQIAVNSIYFSLVRERL
jgi:hypothetical protein